MAEQVAVVEARAATEGAHLFPQLRLHKRVDDDRGPSLHPVHRKLQVIDRLDTRMADLDELLIGELRLERLDEPRGGFAGGIRHDMELNGRVGHWAPA